MNKNIKDKKFKDYTEKGKKVSWLKSKLQEVLETLDFYDDDDEIEIAGNTYWVGPYFLSYPGVGFIDLEEPVKEKEEVEDSKVKDGMTQLETALKMEKDTIAAYKEFGRIAGDGDNPEKQLWDHLIKDEEEHVIEIEAAMKGDYTKIVHDASNQFQQSVDGVAKLLRQKDLQENVSFAEGDQSFKTVLVETPVDKFDSVLEALKEQYKIDSHNGKNRIFVKIEDAVNISMKSEEQVEKEQEIDSEFKDRINDCLVDGGLDYKSFRITNEDKDFYVDFDSNEEDAKKAYELLKDSLFECNFVNDEGFYYVHVIRR